MFARLGRFVVTARWVVLAAAAVLVAVGATWGTGVFGSLSSGGFADQDSASAKVRQQVVQQLGL